MVLELNAKQNSFWAFPYNVLILNPPGVKSLEPSMPSRSLPTLIFHKFQGLSLTKVVSEVD